MGSNSHVEQWLDTFASAVSSQDIARGRALFDEDVVAYGTRTGAMEGLARLVDEQWTPIWTSTRAFRFTAVDSIWGNDQDSVVAARWASEALDGQLREGRCSLVLHGRPPVCVHSHFSLMPDDGGRV
jgi:hypothetical protein